MQIKSRYVALFGILRGGKTTRILSFPLQTDSSKGLTDPFLGAVINLKGMPPMSMQDVRQFTPATLVHLLLGVSLPLGEYDSSNVINLGSNRHTFRFGTSLAYNECWLEGDVYHLKLVHRF